MEQTNNNKSSSACMVIILYSTALLNAVECSVHLHGPCRLQVVNFFFNNDRCYAYNDRCQGKSQRPRLLSDVTVSGGLFLC